MTRAFEAMRTGGDEDPHLHIQGRTIIARRRAGSMVWFEFAALCDGPRSQRDYLEIARRFAVVIVSGIPRMGPDTADQARRFTWLVDILYDHRVKLIASAEAPPEALYTQGPNAQEFPRTVSRLIEMRTHDYMALPHSSEETPGVAPA
jgi:cell division protein ZapE